MARYRKLPVEVEAVRWDGLNDAEVQKLAPEANVRRSGFDGEEMLPRLLIETLEGNLYAPVGHYIIRGVKGELHPCRPDIFAETYEEVGGE